MIIMNKADKPSANIIRIINMTLDEKDGLKST
jgi:hypothetical protein